MTTGKPSSLVPKLRFPEFRETRAWSKHPLGEFLTPIVREREKPAVPYTGLGIRSRGKGTFRKEAVQPEKTSMERLYEVDHKDLIVNITFAWEGAIAIVPPEDAGALVSHRFPTYRIHEDAVLPDFFRHQILDQQFIYELGVASPGGAGRNRVLNKAEFLKIEFARPEIAEQQKISECLGSLDDLIAAENRKLDVLRQHRQGLLQKLLPQEGETLPRLRFHEFRDAGEWEEKRLGDLGRLVSGLTYSPKDVQDDGLLVLRSSNIQNGEVTLDDCVYVRRDVNGANLTQPDDILICVRNGSKSLIGKNAIVPNGMPVCTHGAFMTVFRASSVPHFAYALLQTTAYQKQVAADLGATINSINGSQLLKYCFTVPKLLAEQQRIAECLSSLDVAIAGQARKLDILRRHKQGLLQQLFPSQDAAEQ